MDIVQGVDVVVMANAGSHLFGTNTENSDRDINGVFLPDTKDILLGTIVDPLKFTTGDERSKNTNKDIDWEVFSLKNFIHMLAQGQTAALELLFTPKEMITKSSEVWEEIQMHRKMFLSKNVKAFVGYCRHQANKYGAKGSRMYAIKKVVELLHMRDPNERLSEFKDLEEITQEMEYVEFVWDNKQINRCFSIADRKFVPNVKIGYVIEVLNKIYETYGERAKQAERNEGVDFKALSHAVRVCYQAIEFLNHHHITLPLHESNREVVMMIKKKQLHFKDIEVILDRLIEEVLEADKNSTLPENVNMALLNDFIFKIYSKKVLKDIALGI